jgi:Flp pilus assembly pilin Flp
MLLFAIFIKRGNMKNIRKDTRGLSTVEYVILLILIAVVGIAAWRTFGNTVVSKINQGNSQVSGLGGS